ncbi:MAG: hypothetical protein RLZZ481_1693 [Pseudomonadota bacterium]|jgi:hypothetical protein
MASHSLIVGGSTAKRVINCPGSVALVAKMPPKDSSTYADRGTLLHNAMATILDSDTVTPESMLWTTYKGETLTGELLNEKILPALAALDAVDPEGVMEYAVETVVGFGAYLPGVFGSADLLGRLGNRAVVLDWKFGDGVAVSAEENEQGLFYAAAAMRTPETAWVFEGAEEVEIVIVQPPAVKRWVTTVKRVKEFERALKRAVKASAMPDAAIVVGDHCRWCSAKPLCPKMTGAVDRAVKVQLENLPAETIGAYLGNADLLEDWIKDLRGLAMTMMEGGTKVPGYKLVAKRSVRKWLDEGKANKALAAMGIDPVKLELVSPAQAEKLLKPSKQALPDELVASVSSGTTFAPESDPRPEVLQIGQQLSAALGRLV